MNENCKPIRIGNIYGDPDHKGYSIAGNVWDVDNLSPALSTMQGGHREPLIVEVENEQSN